MLKGKGKIWKACGNARCQTAFIPAGIVTDSQYPFKLKERTVVEIDPKNQRLIISKVKPKESPE